MKQHLCRVIENRILWAEAQLLLFDAPELARSIRPGQFALARDPNTLDPYLRRTLWLYQVEAGRVAFTLSSRDALAVRARAGDELDLYAPLGRAIELEASVRRVLLIGEGMRVVNTIALAHAAVASGREVVLAHIPSSPDRVGQISKFVPPRSPEVEHRTDVGQISKFVPLLSPEIEYHTDVGQISKFVPLLSPEIEYRTDDGLNAELIVWADAIVASGSPELYRALRDAIRAARYRLEPGFARGLLDLPMPCGTGACYVCAVDTARGAQRACVEGPAFDLIELENWRAR